MDWKLEQSKTGSNKIIDQVYDLIIDQELAGRVFLILGLPYIANATHPLPKVTSGIIQPSSLGLSRMDLKLAILDLEVKSERMNDRLRKRDRRIIESTDNGMDGDVSRHPIRNSSVA